MDRVYDTFEGALIFARNHPSWFDWTGENLKKMMDLYDTGFIKVMKNRDEKGRRIVILNSKLDIAKYEADDVYRLITLVILVLSLEYETQICGIIYVDYYCGVNMKCLSIFSLKSTYDYACQLRVAPIRIQNIFIVGLPAFAVQLVNMMRLALTDKMSERFKIIENIAELHKFVDKSMLTQDYGGPHDNSETIDEFRILINEKLEALNKFFDFEIDMAKAEMMMGMNEACGSFRKLEID